MPLLTTGAAGLTPEYQAYFDRKLLMYAKPLIVTAQFAQKRPFPKNKGATSITFFRPDQYDRTQINTLTEGVALSQFRNYTLTPINVSLTQYGEAVKISDIVTYTDLFNTLNLSIRVMGEDAGAFADFLCVQLLGQSSAVNQRYAGGAANFAGLVALSPANAKLAIFDLLGAMTKLTTTKAKKPEGREYPCIITPQQMWDVEQDQKFIDSGSRGSSTGLFDGEVGRWYGNRILVTTEGWIEGTGAQYTYNSAGTIYSALVVGREAFGATVMGGQSPFNPSMIVNTKPDSGNPLAQFITAGWKSYWATVILNATWACVVRSQSTFVP